MSSITAGNFAGAAVWEAIGTSVVLRVTDPAQLDEAVRLLADELEAMDRVASRFRPDSELERVNAQAGVLTAVSERLYEALSVALRAARLSGGLLDPTIGGALIKAGYDRDRHQLDRALSPEPAGSEAVAGELPVQPQAYGWWDLRLVAAGGFTSAALLAPAGIWLDLGATAKALIADRAATVIAAATGCGVLVSLGGDIATAGPAPAAGWQIHVTDDHRSSPDSPGQTVTITGGALATSSTTTLRWSHKGRDMHHIIDPRTGQPTSSPWRTVSVTAGSCVDANTASTTAIVLGDEAPEWLEERSLPARLVAHDSAVRTLCGWPQEAS
jgi:FAD:protein FMN transferase